MLDEQRGEFAGVSERASVSAQVQSRVPWITWAISGVAAVVTVAAVVVFLSPPPEESAVPSPAAEELLEPALPDSIPAGSPPPLSLAEKLLIAQQRASIWNPNAQLAGVSLVIEKQKPLGPIEFKFGVPTGPAIPGSPIGTERYTLTFNGDALDAAEIESTAGAVALAAPNCPLEAAFRALKSLGVPAESRIGALLIHSERHRRPVWLMTTSDGQAHQVNAENCVMLRR